MYGLPENGGTCPGATKGVGGCLDVRDGLKRQTCYMAKIVTIYKAVGNVLMQNTEALQGKTRAEMEVILDETVAAFVKKSDKQKLFFRLHYSGDFFSLDYAKAWASVIKKYPNVRFWVYTRSFTEKNNYVEPLLGLCNLSVYLSCDTDNFNRASELYEKLKDQHSNLGLAWLGDVAPDPAKFRWVKCPEVTGKIKNTDGEGACSKCRLCVDNYKIRTKNIQFLVH